MAQFNFWFIPLLAIIFGSFPCGSDKACTDIKIIECVINNVNHSNNCLYDKRIVACVNNLIGDCSDTLKVIATSQKNYFTRRAAECPGLPEGQCLHNSLKECLHDFLFPKGELLTKKQCQSIKSKSAVKTNCLRELKSKCRNTSRVDDHLRFINEASKTCAAKLDLDDSE